MKTKKHYTHLLFDLDHTLWDTDKNAGIALVELYRENNLQQYGIADYREFVDKYTTINNRMWTDYALGKIKKSYLRTGRFELTLKHFNINDKQLVEQLAEFFVNRTPSKKHLLRMLLNCSTTCRDVTNWLLLPMVLPKHNTPN